MSLIKSNAAHASEDQEIVTIDYTLTFCFLMLTCMFMLCKFMDLVFIIRFETFVIGIFFSLLKYEYCELFSLSLSLPPYWYAHVLQNVTEQSMLRRCCCLFLFYWVTVASLVFSSH